MPPGGTMGENRRDSPLRRGGAKELREHLEHVPPRTRGDFRGVTGNPHQVLIQNRGYPPQVPPWPRGDESESNELLQGLTNSFIPSGGAGGCPVGKHGPHFPRYAAV